MVLKMLELIVAKIIARKHCNNFKSVVGATNVLLLFLQYFQFCCNMGLNVSLLQVRQIKPSNLKKVF